MNIAALVSGGVGSCSRASYFLMRMNDLSPLLGHGSGSSLCPLGLIFLL
ncbi:MAG: hypothetical protein VB072_17405 [Lentimicrobium sp.]|nr:hypothetical protein [Lentimicrobium sp.]MEA5112199.1 hypothetical protein [Lentimicrobium sp.]